jgi:hypothetical protein
MIPLELSGILRSDESTAPVVALASTTRHLGGYVGPSVSQMKPAQPRIIATTESKFAFGLAMTSKTQRDEADGTVFPSASLHLRCKSICRHNAGCGNVGARPLEVVFMVESNVLEYPTVSALGAIIGMTESCTNQLIVAGFPVIRLCIVEGLLAAICTSTSTRAATDASHGER